MNPTFERVVAIVAQEFQLPPERLTADAPLDGLGIDSLSTVELLWQLEEAFAIRLPAKASGLKTLGDVARFIDGLVTAQGRSPALADRSAAAAAPPG